MATARGPIPNRPERRITPPVSGRTAGTIALVVLAALIGWLAHSAGTEDRHAHDRATASDDLPAHPGRSRRRCPGQPRAGGDELPAGV